MSEKKPALVALRVRPNCPVCGKVSYSLSGMHPQCAVARADAGLRARQKAKKEPPPPRAAFTKRCPKCGRNVPARRMVCDCGRSFDQRTAGNRGSASHSTS